jgi:fumarate reductase flavoprotein subunit
MKIKRKIPEKKKSVLSSLFWVPLLLGNLGAALLPGCAGSDFIREAGFIPGIYEGSGQGYRGSVHVRVQVSPSGIEDIMITDHSDSSYPGAAAMEELLDLVLEYGSTDLDAVSGASFSSRGFLEAVDDALRQARGF